MKKKFCMGALAALLALCLAACTGSDPLAAAQENVRKAASMDARLVMELDMDVAGETLETVTAMDVSVFNEPSRMKMDMSMEMGLLGSLTATLYAEETGEDTYTLYTYDGQQWRRETAAASQLEEYDFSGDMDYYISSSPDLTQEGVEDLDGAAAYKYTGTITGDAMRGVMLQSGALDSLTASMSVDEEQIAGLLDGLESIVVTLWIDKETLCPVRMEMDMTAAVNGLMDRLLEEMGGQSTAGTAVISRMSMTLTCSNFNNATDFTIPQEALA